MICQYICNYRFVHFMVEFACLASIPILGTLPSPEYRNLDLRARSDNDC
jgi:hypothetical protein